jgi:hypothetical protein
MWCRLEFLGVQETIRNMKQLVNAVEGFLDRRKAVKLRAQAEQEQQRPAQVRRDSDGHEGGDEDNDAMVGVESGVEGAQKEKEMEGKEEEKEGGKVVDLPTTQTTTDDDITSFMRFDVGEREYVIVLNTDEVVREEATILATHSIAHPKSADLC